MKDIKIIEKAVIKCTKADATYFKKDDVYTAIFPEGLNGGIIINQGYKNVFASNPSDWDFEGYNNELLVIRHKENITDYTYTKFEIMEIETFNNLISNAPIKYKYVFDPKKLTGILKITFKKEHTMQEKDISCIAVLSNYDDIENINVRVIDGDKVVESIYCIDSDYSSVSRTLSINVNEIVEKEIEIKQIYNNKIEHLYT